MAKIILADENIDEIANELIDNNIVGISGSRTYINKVMRKVVENIEKYNEKQSFDEYKIEISTPSAIDHPDANIGYLFNLNEYSYDEAKNEIINSYEF